MKRLDYQHEVSGGCGTSPDDRQRTTVLAVGDIDEWQRNGGSLPADGKLAFIGFDAVTPELFDLLSPGIVLSPLLARGFDCIDLAQVLHRIGFKGSYRAMSQVLPDPAIIREEIASLCPGLDFDLIALPPRDHRPN